MLKIHSDLNDTVTNYQATRAVMLHAVFSGSSGRYDSYEGGGRTEYKSKCMVGG